MNGAAALSAPLAPEAVLERLQAVERAMGRRRGVRWGPRVCDLDLLASGASVLPDAATVREWIGRAGARQMEVPPGLILPHPRMHERGFVLAPLAEVAPDWRHPLVGRTVREMLAALPAGAIEGVERIWRRASLLQRVERSGWAGGGIRRFGAAPRLQRA